MDLAEVVLQEIRLLVACGFENRESLYRRIFETMGEALGLPGTVTTLEEVDPATSARLRAAIEDAFARKEQESRAWTSPTDCERLAGAFALLNEQGIVALENCGFTQADGVHRAALVAAARDELGGVATHGYCFFHEQDVMHAVEGTGLTLAFGTFKEDPGVPGPPPASAGGACPTCGGRGWIQPDPNKFPERCPNHVAAPAVSPLPGPAQQVGASVVAACRSVGLTVEWNGSAGTRLHLPAFQWRRRAPQASEAEVVEFLASWELELRAGYSALEEIDALLDERAGDWFAGFANFGPGLLERLRRHTQRFLEEERGREATWAEATVNDRIAAAFADLRERHVLAAECAGLTIQDGWGYAGLDATAEHRGAVFFHHEDVIDAVNGQGLLLSYGALPVDASSAEQASFALAQEIMSVLEEHGIPCDWGKSVRERIRIAPFEWRRRRWTKAPVHERSPKTASRARSLWSRLFSGSASAGPAPSRAASARQFAEVVRAVRDERGFDLRRAGRMRAAWKHLGAGGDGQVGHLGLPHVFVRAGEFTTMMPVPALENLCVEKNEIFLRAARARSSRPSGSAS